MSEENLKVLTSFPFSQEWVTDSPFIISPRITFEVSVRLLGGLMALGYTIATILKRSSHIFSDGRVCVKTDWLEQLNRKYTQVRIYLMPIFVGLSSYVMVSGSYLFILHYAGLVCLYLDPE